MQQIKITNLPKRFRSYQRAYIENGHIPGWCSGRTGVCSHWRGKYHKSRLSVEDWLYENYGIIDWEHKVKSSNGVPRWCRVWSIGSYSSQHPVQLTIEPEAK